MSFWTGSGKVEERNLVFFSFWSSVKLNEHWYKTLANLRELFRRYRFLEYTTESSLKVNLYSRFLTVWVRIMSVSGWSRLSHPSDDSRLFWASRIGLFLLRSFWKTGARVDFHRHVLWNRGNVWKVARKRKGRARFKAVSDLSYLYLALCDCTNTKIINITLGVLTALVYL